MSTDNVKRAKADLETALKELSVLGVRLGPFGPALDPPAVTVGPPSITWDGYSPEPRSAEFTVFLVSAFDDRVVERLIDLVEPTIEAIESVPNFVAGEVVPTNYVPQSLPCYSITASCSLS